MVRPLLTTLALAVVLTTACDSRGGGLIGVTPPATKIAFVVQPSDALAGVPIFPAVEVHVQNADNQTVPNANVAVQLSIAPGTGTTGAVLSGGAPISAVNGVARFTTLRVDLVGTGYQLTATAPGFTTITSTAFRVTP
jgi:hypothetical protein